MIDPIESSLPAAGRLCPACSLCCNGVLFADVRLPAQDDPSHLRSLGLPVRRRGRTWSFCQPCTALNADGHCRIYHDRPRMCHQFECGVLQDFEAGKLTDPEAFRLIRKARKAAQLVSRLLVRSGNHDTHQPLTKRYQAVMVQPIDLSAGDEAGDLRGELMLAVHALMELLHRYFLRGSQPVRDAGDQEPV